jgi:hypothetical protein
LSEYRFHITLAEGGRDPANGERLLDAFMDVHPEVGPSVSQDTVAGTLSITFSLDATDANDAIDLGRPIFARGTSASGLPSAQVVGMEISLVPAEEHDVVGESERVPV